MNYEEHSINDDLEESMLKLSHPINPEESASPHFYMDHMLGIALQVELPSDPEGHSNTARTLHAQPADTPPIAPMNAQELVANEEASVREDVDRVSSEEEQAEEGDEWQQGWTKKLIQFRHPSLARRNVDKAIVRALLKAYHRNTRGYLKDPIWTALSWREQQFYCELLNQLKKAERNREGPQPPKDYARVISRMVRYPFLRLLLSDCMQRQRQRLASDPPKTMKDENRFVYIDTLDDYLNSIAMS